MRPAHRRTLGAAVALLFAFALVAPQAAQAAQQAHDGVIYEIAGDSAIAVGYDATANPRHPRLVLPSTVDVDGEVVSLVAVGDSAFQARGLEVVQIPDTVEVIEDYAFAQNPIARADLGSGVQQIGEWAFSSGTALQVQFTGPAPDIRPADVLGSFGPAAGVTLYYPAEFDDAVVEGAGFTAPQWQGYAAQISAPGSLGDIVYAPLDPADPGAGAVAADYVGDGGAIEIPDTVELAGQPHRVVAIGESAFARAGVTEVRFGASVRHIGAFAFEGNALTSMRLPDGLLTIGSTAFAGNALESSEFGEELRLIGDFAFAQNALTEVHLGDAVTSIQSAAFVGNAIERASFGDSLAAIDSFAFTLNDLREVRFGAALELVGEGAFSANPRLERVFFDGPAPSVRAFDADEAFEDQGALVHLGSFGDAAGKVLVYDPEFDDAVVEGAGFTTPAWQGYMTESVDPAVVTELVVEASATAVSVGDAIALTVHGVNASGEDLGDVTDEVEFSSDVAADRVEGNRVTFGSASVHTITAEHVDGATAEIEITVREVPGEVPGEGSGGVPGEGSGGVPGEGSGEGSGGAASGVDSAGGDGGSASVGPGRSLPAAGGPGSAWVGLGAALVLLGGLSILAARARRAGLTALAITIGGGR